MQTMQSPKQKEDRKEDRQPLLRVENLKKYYTQNTGLFGRTHSYVKAVDDVSFELYEGETLGLVGESGCGKSTLGRQLVGLEQPDSGAVWYQGRKLTEYSQKERRDIRTQIQMVFQDSYSSLNPRKHIYEILTEPMLYHGFTDKTHAALEAERLLERVGLPADVLNRYPHEFSGGQRQRIGIARALSLKPKLLICDEPVSALDVSIQAQILNLLRQLQQELQLTCIFIGHGLGAVNYVSRRIAVMYLGQLVELADSAELFASPCHPYSQALFKAVPKADPRNREEAWKGILEGEAGIEEESALAPDKKGGSCQNGGCAFYPRCPRRTAACLNTKQLLRPVSPGSSHLAACSRLNPL